MEKIQLYRKNSFGIGTWAVWAGAVQGQKAQILVGHSSVEDGAMITHVEDIVTNGSGRSLQEQVELRMKSRVNRQLDKGYKYTREEALLGSTNQMGLVNPMLAQKIADVQLNSGFFPAHVQRKYDGHRCMITKQGGEIIAYTRKGKPITTISHILENLDDVIQDGDTLDGELYIHGLNLQSLSSLIKRQQPESRALCFMWYDMCDPFRPFEDRYRVMRELHANISTPQIMLCPTYEVVDEAAVWDFFTSFRADGYEGAMLRLSRGVVPGYKDAKRSAQLLKVKQRMDCEATVTGFQFSKEGWAILKCRLDNGVMFDTSAPGSVEEKLEVAENFPKYVGRRVTIEFANLTADGVPFHAVATRWHEEL